MAAAALVAAFLLAGCLGGGDAPRPTPTPSPGPTGPPAPPAPPDAVVPLLVDFRLEGCRGFTVVGLHPLEEVQSWLPEPFTAEEARDPVLGLGLGQGTLRTQFYACDALETPNVRVEGVFLGRVAMDVEPPEGLHGAEVPTDARHAYLVRMLAGEDPLQNVWRAAGYDVHNGTAGALVSSLTGSVGLPGAGPSTSATGWAGDYRADGAGLPLQEPAEPVATVHHTLLADGARLQWSGAASMPLDVLGEARLNVPDDDVAAPSAGTSRTGTLEASAEASFTQQSLVRVPAPPGSP